MSHHQPCLMSHSLKTISGHWNSLGELGTNACYHARTLLLFTGDQILDTVIPGTAFAIFAALSGPVLDLPSQWSVSILSRIPYVSLWLWLVILQFCIQNQRSASSVAEDLINKPWRPIPSGRMTSEEADKLLSVATLIAGFLSYRLNIGHIFAVYMCLITAYNDYGGGNKSGVLRNIFCGAGFLCYFSGALSIAIGQEGSMRYMAWMWAAILTMGVLSTTIQTQEFRDEVGDKARGRRTLVTELGRKPAFWTVFIPVAFWSIFVPLGFFAGDLKIILLPVLFGGALLVTSIQAYVKGNSKLDRKMYKFWCLWMFAFCPLPFVVRVLA